MNKTLKSIAAAWPLVLVAPVQAADNWDFMLEPFVLGTNIEGDSGIGRLGESEVDVDFETILDNLDFGIMVHAEALHESGWGLWFDYGLMDLKNDKNSERGGVVDARVKQGVTELALMYRMNLGAGELWDIRLGARHWENELRLKFVPAIDILGQRTFRIKPDWTDAFIGGRYTMPFSEHWSGYLSGDIGAGDADFTGSLRAGVNYVFNDTWGLDLAYKGLWVDYEEGRQGSAGSFSYDTVTHGPIVGVIINF